MNVYSSGNKYKSAAEAALAKAQGIEDYQSNVEFGRNLLANIRQERIARSQLELGNSSVDFSSSSAAGAIANIDSSLAGEMRYSYETSHRAQKITDLHESAEKNFKKYAKQQQTRATAFAVTGAVLGAAGGALGAGMVAGGLTATEGALVGMQVGQGIGQVASNTGMQNTQQGIQGILGGAASYMRMTSYNGLKSTYDDAKELSKYELSSVDPQTNQVIPGTTINAGSYYTLMKIGKAGLHP